MAGTPIKIGYSLSLTGPLAANGQTAHLAHQIWQEDINARGGLLGRQIDLVCIDDRTDAASVRGIYQSLLTEHHVDLLLGGYGNNSISPAMPVAIEHGKFFVGLMGLGVNNTYQYDRFFAMIPTGPDPSAALTEGFFQTASRQTPKPVTVAVVAADADFTKNPIAGARANAGRYGMRVVSETKYPLATTDFAAVLRQAEAARPDILFLCSYLADSVGLIRAIAGSGTSAKLVGGAMIGPQSSTVQAELGPQLNGIVNYEYWLPVPAMDFPGVGKLIATYQSRAKDTPADALGYYVAPFAYAQLQIVEQAIRGTGGLSDAELADYTRTAEFPTVVGDVTFGRLGEWAAPRVLTVQFRDIRTTGIAEFAKPDARVVVSPASYASGDLTYPYQAATNMSAP
jgi:branched-chain amino acid transport system substrate-binding protein